MIYRAESAGLCSRYTVQRSQDTQRRIGLQAGKDCSAVDTQLAETSNFGSYNCVEGLDSQRNSVEEFGRFVADSSAALLSHFLVVTCSIVEILHNIAHGSLSGPYSYTDIGAH